MTQEKITKKNLFYLLLAYLLLWIILFEFILPVNNILPKPSVVWLSFSALWNDYHLLLNFINTFSAVYVGIILAFFLMREFISFFMHENHSVAVFIKSLQWFSAYVPGILLGLFLIYWFPGSNVIEFVYAFLVAFFSFIIKIQNDINKVPNEYLDSAKSLGANDNIIARKVIWKYLQPGLVKHTLELNLYLWSVVVIFEFIKGGYGLGTIFRNALSYKDLSAIFTTIIIIGLTIYLTAFLIKYLRNKFIHWGKV